VVETTFYRNALNTDDAEISSQYYPIDDINDDIL
jgi:hypothetical protein